MAISPFSARPASPQGERRLNRLVVLIAAIGIAATLLAYAVSPGVRHAVGHAAHSVKRTVSHVLDRDKGAHAHSVRAAGSASTPSPTTGSDRTGGTAARGSSTGANGRNPTTTRTPAGVP